MKIYLIFKLIKKIKDLIALEIHQLVCRLLLIGNNISFKSFKSKGIPYIHVAIGSICTIGDNFRLNNGKWGNLIGCFEPCTLFVDKNASLIIGNNVGISQTSIICHFSITIGDNVKIGGGACVYDTDFHSLYSSERNSDIHDKINTIMKPVTIGNNVFIGAKSIILKGVSIGENSVIGAGSVVTKSIPANQIWAGNPARFIRNID